MLLCFFQYVVAPLLVGCLTALFNHWLNKHK
ncbi:MULTISPECIES: type I toxin-antitoxin system Fst family toxin [Ligilactobacillus]|nr:MULTISPECIES: type I toxin-antitoxin system Fst family toxin [Ligilactobacillus]MDO3393961.1 type I toxin-antitoxin system Fst family toxin [Ligilactobacillus sp. 110_WCHN]